MATVENILVALLNDMAAGMKKKNEIALKGALHEFLQSYHLEEKVNECRLQEHWEKLMGKTIARYTKKINVRNKKLFITIDSSTLRQELGFSKEKIISIINEAIAAEFINDVIIL